MQAPSRSRLRAATRATARIALRASLVALLIGVLAGVALLMVLPRASGATALSVLSGSMSPKIPVGSLVYVRPVDPGSLRVGDVATYQREEGVQSFVTHRIIEIDSSTEPARFIFKGDANRGPDIKPVPATAIRGEVWWHVPYLGAVRDALNGRAGISLLGVLVLGGYALSQALGAASDRRGDRSAVASRTVHCDKQLLLAVVDSHQHLSRDLGAVQLTSEAATSTWLIATEAADLPGVRNELELLGCVSVEALSAASSLKLVQLGAQSEPTVAPHDIEEAAHAHA